MQTCKKCIAFILFHFMHVILHSNSRIINAIPNSMIASAVQGPARGNLYSISASSVLYHWCIFLWSPSPGFLTNTSCTRILRTFADPNLDATREPCGSQNPTELLHRKLPEPNPTSAPEPSGTFGKPWNPQPGLKRRRMAELIWDEDPIPHGKRSLAVGELYNYTMHRYA